MNIIELLSILNNSLFSHVQKIALLLILILAPSICFAQLPYTFQGGQTGVAEHINANFEYLDVRLTALDGGISPTEHGITYSEANASVGSVVAIGDTDYRLFKAPFIDPYNGVKYHVQTLSTRSIESFLIVGSRAGDIEITNQLISVSKATEIDGYAALIVENCSYQLASGSQRTRCNADIYIYLDDLVMILEVDGLDSNSETNQEFTDYDFTATDTLDAPDAVDNDSHIDAFIDYIKIDEVTL